MQNKFKNLHRPERAAAVDIVLSNGPQTKFAKTDGNSEQSSGKGTSLNMDEYERHLSTLKSIFVSKKWTTRGVQTLLQETSSKNTYLVLILNNHFLSFL